jgi:hypothetical protein
MEYMSIVGIVMSVLGVILVLKSRRKVLDRSASEPDKSKYRRLFAAGIFLMILGVLAQLMEIYWS